MPTSTILSLLKRLLPPGLRPGIRAVYRRVMFAGNRYQCPVCGAHLRHFKAGGVRVPVFEEQQIVGGGFREQAFCPFCGCTDRERLLYQYLQQRTEIGSQPLKVLQVAPEKGVEALLRKATGVDYLSADLYEPDVMVRMDITDIQYPDNSFDVILCSHVLEHVPDDKRAMAELFRVLRPGGWAVLQVPISRTLHQTLEDFAITSPEAREQAFGQKDHVRIYGQDYVSRLEVAGFTVETFRWWETPSNFGGEENRFGLNREEELFVAVKPIVEN